MESFTPPGFCASVLKSLIWFMIAMASDRTSILLESAINWSLWGHINGPFVNIYGSIMSIIAYQLSVFELFGV